MYNISLYELLYAIWSLLGLSDVATYNLEDRLVFSQSLHTKPMPQVLQDGPIRKVVTSFISLKNHLQMIKRIPTIKTVDAVLTEEQTFIFL